MNDSSSRQEAGDFPKRPLWASVTAFILGAFIGLTFLVQMVEPFTDDNRTGALVIAILAVVFASVAMAARHRGRYMAIAALVFGICGIIMYLPS